MKQTILILLDNVSYRLANIMKHGNEKVWFGVEEAEDLIEAIKCLVEESLKP